jgi:hypothetical protein
MKTINKIIDILKKNSHKLKMTTDRQTALINKAWEKTARSLFGMYDKKVSYEIGFHLTDWHRSAAFILAVCLAPEKFTKKEVENEVMNFFSDAPNHVYTAAKLTGSFSAANTFYSEAKEGIKEELLRSKLEQMKKHARASTLETYGDCTVWYVGKGWKVLNEKLKPSESLKQSKSIEQVIKWILGNSSK